MAKEFLLEIGSEEIPSRFIEPAIGKMKELFSALLVDGRVAIEIGARSPMARRGGCPLRSAAGRTAAGYLEGSHGPPEKVAFDAEGKPTKAAMVFAEKNGIP